MKNRIQLAKELLKIAREMIENKEKDDFSLKKSIDDILNDIRKRIMKE